ncbi:MAG TPA: S41 family peptidase [Saprospiraceae bacterium]|nr:S41 family peptidase [Saprospiraceae bacterium]
MDSHKKDNYNIIQPLLLSACIAVGMMVGYKMNDREDGSLIEAVAYDDEHIKLVGRVEELLRFVENKYVDSLNTDDLLNEAVSAIFSKLDPHSSYISPSELADITDQMNGSFNGVGIENFIVDDTINIYQVMENSPASRAGIKAFDKIVTIDDSIIAGKNIEYEKVRSMLRKEKGEKVTLGIMRDKNILATDVTIDVIPVSSVSSSLLPEIETAYIKIERFGSKTYTEFMDEVEKYFQPINVDKKGKAKHLILDLRDNPGGYLPEATNILCQLFAEKDKLLVYTEGRKNKKNEYKSNGKHFFQIDQIVVLIDENTASASEIIAGAIQDWDRGHVIGRRSYGKGLVQEQYDLNNGGAIRLTVARYYTPSGRSIQRDYSDRESYDEDYGARYTNGDLFHKDSTLVDDKKEYFTLVKKRKVTASGGITPDIFVGMDTIFRNENFMLLKSLIPEFTYRYATKNKSKIPNTLEGINNWKVNDDFYKSFSEYALKESQETSIPSGQLNKLDSEIKSNLMKIIIGKSKSESYLLGQDAAIQKASDVIKNKKELK